MCAIVQDGPTLFKVANLGFPHSTSTFLSLALLGQFVDQLAPLTSHDSMIATDTKSNLGNRYSSIDSDDGPGKAAYAGGLLGPPVLLHAPSESSTRI